MIRSLLTLWVATLVIASSGCSRKAAPTSLKPTAFGTAIVESSGGKQLGATGTTLAQPLVVQVNDDQGTAVPGALVTFSGPQGTTFDPPQMLTDSSGQATTNVTLGVLAGRYQLSSVTYTKANKRVEIKSDEIGLGYQQQLGYQIEEKYCARCHNPESTAERVSNYDNLEVKPHAFSEGDTLNKMSDADLTSIIDHGGPALNKSALMPGWRYTLSKSEIQAAISYIRLVSDPPYQASGMVYAQK